MQRHITGVIMILAMFCMMPDVSSAQGPFYPLIVNGSPSLAMSYDAGILTVRFGRSPNAAGGPTTFYRLAPGNAGWVDRPLNADEPTVLKQSMTESQATTAYNRLRQSGGFWRFYCRTDSAGHLEVSRSEPAYASGRLD